jgi:hypothetical protein
MKHPDSPTRASEPRSWITGFFACILFMGAVLAIQPGQANDPGPAPLLPAPMSVVELFSSQSCGACPPATELLVELARRPNILALSWSVDYFDHPGWKDTLAKPSFGARQRHYNMKHGIPGVRTPQMVIGGQANLVGARRGDVETALANPEFGSQPITIERGPEGISFDLPGTNTVDSGTVALVHYRDDVAVDISAGENKGRTMTYRHVVTALKPIAQWDGTARHFSFGRHELCDQGNALLVQDEATGAILFAALINK